MEKKWGIDVSYHNGDIDWKAVKNAGVQFAILRAGYSYSIDPKFSEYARGCLNNNIPIGAYWFSYALNPTSAKREANTCLGVVSKWKIEYPVCFDFEYDSLEYAKKHGINLTNNDMIEIASAFLSEIEKAGYYAMNYSNPDFLGRGFAKLTDRYSLWLARWGNLTEPGYDCGIWQYSSAGKIDGINGNVDMNMSFKDYPSIIQNNKEKEMQKNNDKAKKLIEEIKSKLAELEGVI